MTEQPALFDLKHPAMLEFDAGRVSSRPINYRTASRVVESLHYAHRTPSIMLAIGMYVDAVLAGVCTFGMLGSPNAQKAPLGTEYAKNVCELNRLYIYPWAGKNSESWLISQSLRWIKTELPERFLVVSYADTEQDHVGIIYQATNWIYTGISIPGGNGNEMFVNGVRMSTKNAFDRYGTQGIRGLEKLGLTVEKPAGTKKHRYVFIIGSKTHRKYIAGKLKWPQLPYPKEPA